MCVYKFIDVSRTISFFFPPFCSPFLLCISPLLPLSLSLFLSPLFFLRDPGVVFKLNFAIFVDDKPLCGEYRQACSISPLHCLRRIQLAISIDVVYRWEKFARAFRTCDPSRLNSTDRPIDRSGIPAAVAVEFSLAAPCKTRREYRSNTRGKRMCSSVYTDVLSPWTQEATNYYHDRIYDRAEAWFNGNWVRIINRHGRVERVAARTLTRRARWLTTPVFIVSAALFVVSFVKRWLGSTNYVINALLIAWMDHRSSLALTEDYYYNSKKKKKNSRLYLIDDTDC